MPTVRIDPDDLTIDELEELDELLPGGFDSVSRGKVPMKAMRIIAWLVLRRDDPSITLEDIGQLKMGDFDTGGASPGEASAAAT